MSQYRVVEHHHGGTNYRLATAEDGVDVFHEMAADYGAWTDVQDCLISLTRPGDTIIDAGANIGTVTMPLAARGVDVIAYEALGKNVGFLKAGLSENDLKGSVTIREVALWDRADRLSFTGSSAWGRVAEDGVRDVEAVTLDEDIPSGTRVKVVKLDVEGAELHVLKGMRVLIENQRPHIVFESNSLELGRLGSSAAGLLEFLHQYHYGVYRIYARHRLLDPGGIPQEISVADYLATPLGPWQLRWQTENRVGRIRARHIIRRILDRGEQEWVEHLHMLIVADRLPDSVRHHPEIARRLSEWQERYQDHPMLETIRLGIFGAGEPRQGRMSGSETSKEIQ